MDYVNKTPRFAAQSDLNHAEGVSLRDKATLAHFLEQFGGVQSIDREDNFAITADKVCHNASLIPIILEHSCNQKIFTGVSINIGASPHQIYLDKAGIIRMEAIDTPQVMYSP